MRCAPPLAVVVAVSVLVTCTGDRTSSTGGVVAQDRIVLQRGDAARSGHFDTATVDREPVERWRKSLPAEFLGTPLVADGILYSGGSDGLLYAVDATTGDVKWRVGGFELIETATAIAGDTIIAGGFNGRVVALDRHSGNEQWTYDAGTYVFAAPLVADSQVFVATFKALHALDLATGRAHWSTPLGDVLATTSAPALAAGRLFVSSGQTLFALDASSGREMWRVDKATPFWGLALGQGQVYVGNGDGRLYAYDQASGDERWTFAGTYRGGDDIWSAPAVTAELVIAAGRANRIHALDAATGHEVWHHQTAGPAVGEAVVSRGFVYLSDSNHDLPNGTRRLFALDLVTGDPRWTYTTRSTLLTTPALADGVLYTTVKNALVALAPAAAPTRLWLPAALSSYEIHSRALAGPALPEDARP